MCILEALDHEDPLNPMLADCILRFPWYFLLFLGFLA